MVMRILGPLLHITNLRLNYKLEQEMNIISDLLRPTMKPELILMVKHDGNDLVIWNKCIHQISTRWALFDESCR